MIEAGDRHGQGRLLSVPLPRGARRVLSFNGVIGAFAITCDPIIIALGLGFIGAMFVRSITIYLARKGTLLDYVNLKQWAIGALAVILFDSKGIEINKTFTGLTGVALIARRSSPAFYGNVRQ